MRALLHDPDAPHGLRLGDADEPEPGPSQALVEVAAAGELDPQVGWRGGWERAGEAIEALRGRRVRGKAVLEVSR